MLYNQHMAPLELVLLGSFQARFDEEAITGFRYDKVRALFAYLAVERDRAHRRDELIGLFWPDSAEEDARTSLRQALTQLRAAVGDLQAAEPTLLVSRECVQWNPAADAAVDVITFEAALKTARAHIHRNSRSCRFCAQQLARAVEQYQGDFLAHLFLPGSEAFDDWVVLKREALRRQALEALDQLASYHERRGETLQAEAHLRRQLAIDPWQEEVHRRLMRLLATRGQRSAAIVQYEQCRRQLVESLGVAPQPETSRLYESIRAGEGSGPAWVASLHLPERRKHNLPPPLTPFIGRKKELAALSDLLDRPEPRLITLVGPGGVGKTRLALQAAADQLACFADGVFFVSLAPVTQADLIPTIVGDALDLPLLSDADPLQQLLKVIADQEILLILDNLEHIPTAAEFILELLGHAPGITILATSRERLKLRCEWVFPVEGLPTVGPQISAGDGEETSADLFIQCARRFQPGFGVDPVQREAIGQICWLLDGLPLAIELAAPWTRLLPCTEIAQEIQNDIDFLAEEGHGVPARHTSMRAVFDHSWNLLSLEEQSVFRKLSIFRSGFEREAAGQVAGATLPQLCALLDKSLIKRTPFDRYDMHDIAHQYTYQQLISAGEEPAVRDLALGYYLALAERASPRLETEQGPSWLIRLEEEMDNIRAALEWATASGQIETGMRLAWALCRFFYAHSHHIREGRRWLEGLLSAAQGSASLPPDLMGKVLFEVGVIASIQQDFGSALPYLTHSLEIRQSIGDQSGLAAVFSSLGGIAFEQQDFAKARALFEDSLALRRKIGEKPAVQLNNLGMIARFEENYPKAIECSEESLKIFQENHNLGGIAVALCNLAGTELRLGARVQAFTHYRESLRLRCEIDDKEGIAYELEGLATCYVSGEPGESDPLFSTRLFGAADALRKTIGLPIKPTEGLLNQDYIDAARASLGETAFQKAWQEGGKEPLPDLIQRVLEANHLENQQKT